MLFGWGVASGKCEQCPFCRLVRGGLDPSCLTGKESGDVRFGKHGRYVFNRDDDAELSFRL